MSNTKPNAIQEKLVKIAEKPLLSIAKKLSGNNWCWGPFYEPQTPECLKKK